MGEWVDGWFGWVGERMVWMGGFLIWTSGDVFFSPFLQGLKVGDRIIDVNGTDFTNLTHAEAVTMMRNAWNIIMTVETDSATGTSLSYDVTMMCNAWNIIMTVETDSATGTSLSYIIMTVETDHRYVTKL